MGHTGVFGSTPARRGAARVPPGRTRRSAALRLSFVAHSALLRGPRLPTRENPVRGGVVAWGMKHASLPDADPSDTALMVQMFGDVRPLHPARRRANDPDLGDRLLMLMLLAQGQGFEAAAAAAGCDRAFVERLWATALEAIETC